MSGRLVRRIAAWLGVVVILALLALFAPLASLPGPLPTAVVSPVVAPPGATPAAVGATALVSEARGFIAVEGGDASAVIRRETDLASLGGMRGRGFNGAVSGTGRRVAYWVTERGGTRELRVFDATAVDQDTALTLVTDAERGTGVAWSSDRTGLVISVDSGGGVATADAPGMLSALRLVDAPTRSVQEIARLADGTRFHPVAWDRGSRLASACVANSDGAAVAYVVVGEDALSTRAAMAPGIPVTSVRSSQGAVLGVVDQGVIRVWRVTSYDDHTELGAAAGERIRFARWRPGGTEIVVAVADRLELWPAAGGDRRVIATVIGAPDDLLVSTDGVLAFLTFDGGRRGTAFDIGTGRSAPLPIGSERIVAPISFR